MKKTIFALFASALLSLTSYAGNNNNLIVESNRDENGNIVRGPYVTGTKWYENWFFEAQGGIIVIGAQGMGQGIANDFQCLVPQENFGFNIGKWIIPDLGLRMGYQGFKTCWREPKLWNTQHQSLGYLHFDVMWNLSNTLGGYKTKRVYNAIPYIHGGFIWQNSEHSGENNFPGLGVGLLNSFRVTRWLAVTLDLRWTGTKSACLGRTYMSYDEQYIHKIGSYASAQLGLAFTLKGGFQRATTNARVQAQEANDALRAMKDRNSDLQRQIDSLRNAMPDCDAAVAAAKAKWEAENKKKEQEKVVKVINNLMPTMFDQGSAVIKPEVMAVLDYNIQALDKDTKYMITGYTSLEGSKELNQRLRILRPEAVKRLLVEKYGFNPDNINVRAAEEDENLRTAIRAAIIRPIE